MVKTASVGAGWRQRRPKWLLPWTARATGGLTWTASLWTGSTSASATCVMEALIVPSSHQAAPRTLTGEPTSRPESPYTHGSGLSELSSTLLLSKFLL